MKILIAYASAGTGHKKAAEALYQEAKSQNIDDVILVDILDYTNAVFKFFYSFGYTFLITYLPNIWGILFDLTNNPQLSWLNLNLEFAISRLNAQRFLSLLKKASPDIIISTHFMVNEMASIYKKSRPKVKLFSVVTDFYSHIYWKSDAVDKYIVACEFTKEQLIGRGIASQNITVQGIPIDKKFSLESDRQQICQKLSIRPDKFTVLVVTGAIGIGPIREIVQVLKDDVQVLVVCGYNSSLKKDLEKIKHNSIKAFGFVDNMDELMSASDCIVTKAGGLSISESLAKSLAMIFFNIIPGQEANNAKIISDYGAGFVARDLSAIRDAVFRFKNNPKELERMKESIKKISQPKSSEMILELINERK